MDSQAQDVTDGRRAGLNRLTEREKDCLRRWLRRQTAKEIAIDLNVSPHAVEKRLKMARAKLGVSTSLDAARLLATYERYQRSGPQQPDLDDTTPKDDSGRTKLIAFGVILMNILALILLAALGDSSSPSQEALDIPKPGEIVVAGSETFNEIDTDGSGLLEGEEAPKLLLVGGKAEAKSNGNGGTEYSGDYVIVPESNSLRDRFYREADTNGDGAVSLNEFQSWVNRRDSEI